MTKEKFRYFSFTLTHTIHLSHVTRFCTHLSIFFKRHNSLSWSIVCNQMAEWPQLIPFSLFLISSLAWSLCLSKWQEDFCVLLRCLIYIHYKVETFDQYLTYFKTPTFLHIRIIKKRKKKLFLTQKFQLKQIAKTWNSFMVYY